MINRPDSRKSQSRIFKDRTRRPWRLSHRLQTRELGFRCERGSFERIFKRSSSDKRRVRSMLANLGIRLWDLVSFEAKDLSCIANTICFNGLVFLSQMSDQLGGLFFNGESGFSSKTDIDLNNAFFF